MRSSKLKKTVVELWNVIPSSIRFIFKFYLLLMITFFLGRVGFVAIGSSQLAGASFCEIANSFFVGLRYDTAAACYLLIIPWCVSLLLEIVPIRSYKVKKYYLYFLTLYALLAILVLVADIPYYQYMNIRLTNTALGFFDSPKIALKFVIESTEYYPYIFLIIVVTCILYFLLLRFIRSWQKASDQQTANNKKALSRPWIAVCFIVLALFQFAGIRGKITTRRPLSWAEAFVSTNPFLNYAGLNPIFTLGSSALSKTKNNPIDIVIYNPDKAIANVRGYFGIKGNNFSSPIARKCTFDSVAQKHNVVIILMESMSNVFLGRNGMFNPSLTPFLDDLIAHSLYFPNIYSDGIHTWNGVFSIFTSMLSPTSEINAYAKMDNLRSFGGIGNVLKANGYNTFFGCPHDANFDNMGGLLSMNGFEKIFSSKEFGNKEFINTWGTSDHFLFNHCFDFLKKMGRSGKPFLAGLMTISNHGPYILPENLPNSFKPHNKDMQLRAVEYADWSLKYLIDSLRKEPWFDNTIFVFVADHGHPHGSNYEVNYYYKSVPMIFYAPKIIKPVINYSLGCQADLFPTLMEFLRINYVNNTMGVNLLREKRLYVPHSRHSTVMATNDSLMLIRREDGTKLLYKFRSSHQFPKHFDMTDYSKKYPDIAKQMEEYVLSNIQTSITLIKNKKAKYIRY